MRFLLDTHVLLWWLANDSRLSEPHRSLIADRANFVLVSSISIAEVSIKASLGKLEAPANTHDAALMSGFGLLSFEAAHAEELRELPWIHRDPFDRMLVAQARIEKLRLLTADARIRQYDVLHG